jgi:hypothetical protein
MLTPDPMGGRSEGAKAPHEICDSENAFFYVARGDRA